MKRSEGRTLLTKKLLEILLLVEQKKINKGSETGGQRLPLCWAKTYGRWIAKPCITCDNTNGNTTLSEAQGVSLRITSGVRVSKIIALLSFAMSAKDAIHTQTYVLSSEELAEFLELYPVPLEYNVILHKSIQTIYDAHYVGCPKLTTFAAMCKSYGCEPSVELFQGFFNMFPGGKWLTRIEGWKGRFFFIENSIVPAVYPQLLSKDNRWDSKTYKDKLPPKIEENPMFQRLETSFRNFMYVDTNEDLSFLPKEPCLDDGIGSPFVSINTELPLTIVEATKQLVENTVSIRL
ncbi:hypothetical protein Tco_0857043 [Tanacetum coccineum]|uniref:Uncharacterized protein n=1 Tax=Tanacetum coccineum TaxID=301880 RepID=A0ABQ5B5U8_9ASTR